MSALQRCSPKTHEHYNRGQSSRDTYTPLIRVLAKRAHLCFVENCMTWSEAVNAVTGAGGPAGKGCLWWRTWSPCCCPLLTRSPSTSRRTMWCALETTGRDSLRVSPLGGSGLQKALKLQGVAADLLVRHTRKLLLPILQDTEICRNTLSLYPSCCF